MCVALNVYESLLLTVSVLHYVGGVDVFHRDSRISKCLMLRNQILRFVEQLLFEMIYCLHG